jgi:hypothetical protein
VEKRITTVQPSRANAHLTDPIVFFLLNTAFPCLDYMTSQLDSSFYKDIHVDIYKLQRIIPKYYFDSDTSDESIALRRLVARCNS